MYRKESFLCFNVLKTFLFDLQPREHFACQTECDLNGKIGLACQTECEHL